MRIIHVDPDTESVLELDRSCDVLSLNVMVRGKAVLHQIVTDSIPDHVAYVNQNAIRQRQIPWYFDRKIIWGPLVICTIVDDIYIGPARIPVDAVLPLVKFGLGGQS